MNSQVYIATIEELPSLVKIGCSMEPDFRVQSLSYFYDLSFSLFTTFDCDHPFAVESMAHTELVDFLYQAEISPKNRVGYEIFECPVDVAVGAINMAIGSGRSCPEPHGKRKNRRDMLAYLNNGEKFILSRTGEKYTRLGVSKAYGSIEAVKEGEDEISNLHGLCSIARIN